MIELPEAVNLAKQCTETIKGKKIKEVIAGYSPHKFAWYHGDPADYNTRLKGKTIGTATSYGGLVEIAADDFTILFGDGVALRFHDKDAKRPSKHQLLVEFEDTSTISASVQMYGGMWCFKEGEFDNPYYDVAREKPSPLSDEFSQDYYKGIIGDPGVQNLSTKAFLATEQRIPGLGNGVLQDILYNAGIHPKRKVETLTDGESESLFTSVKSTLKEMTEQGGRDTEKNLFGEPGGYLTKLSKNTLNSPCPVCGGRIIKQAYMGGSIYFCAGCQKFP
ncbi:MAG TPA: endonuclease VIII [Dehalococcoidia bacterium]|nr:endonuclease VIII [Dehalococcoidia bacterium]